MKLTTPLLSLLFLGACAATPRARAVQTVVISDAVADEVSARWTDFVDEKIRECRARDLETPEERRACLGAAGEGESLAAALDSLVIVQRAVAGALRCEEVQSCIQDPDWPELARDALSVFKELERLSEASK
jgi:hypothetical protein